MCVQMCVCTCWSCVQALIGYDRHHGDLCGHRGRYVRSACGVGAVGSWVSKVHGMARHYQVEASIGGGNGMCVGRIMTLHCVWAAIECGRHGRGPGWGIYGARAVREARMCAQCRLRGA